LGVACNGTYTKQPERDPNKQSARAGSGRVRQRITKTAQPTPRFNPPIRTDEAGSLPLEGRAVAKESRPREFQRAQLATEENPKTRSQPGAQPTKRARGKGKPPRPRTSPTRFIGATNGQDGRDRARQPPNGDPSTLHLRQPPLAEETQNHVDPPTIPGEVFVVSHKAPEMLGHGV